MGRELIYPGETQIKAVLSPALRHTIAYINILSWAIQVSKGLVHLHFHKGPLSTLWPPFLSCLSFWRVPAVLSFTSLSSSFHFFSPVSLSSSRFFLRHVHYYSVRALLLLKSCLLSTLFFCLLQFLNLKHPNIHSEDQLALLQCLNPPWHKCITCWQTMWSTPWKTGFSWHRWKCHSDLWTLASIKFWTALYYRNNWLFLFKKETDTVECLGLQ